MANVLDLSPADFRNYLAESQGMHGYTPDRINQLRAAYRHHNSLSGALDRAGEQGLDGMNTSTFLPLAGPQGMSIWDALKSGQAQTRFKDWATDALGAVVRGVENPRSAAQGLLSPEEMNSAAMESAGFAMLGAGSIPARLRVPDPGGQTVGTNFGGVGHNQGAPLEPDELIDPARLVDIPTYSPSVRAAEQLPQEKGTYEQFRKMLLDRGAKEDELEWSGFDAYFRDHERVTKAGVLSYLMDNAGDKMIDVESNTAEGILDEDSTVDPDDMISRYVDANLNDEIGYYLGDVRNEWLYDGDHMQARDMDEADLRIAAAEHDITDLDEFKQLLVDEYDGADTWMSPSTWGGGARPRDYTIHADKDAALDYVLDEDMAREMASEGLYEHARSMDVVDLADNLGLGGMANVADSGVKFADWFTKGARDYTESRYIYEPVDYISRGPTFDAAHHDESDIMVHTRTAQFPLSLRSGNAYHVGEVQSDWGQQLRREAEAFGEHGKIYRSRTFDEQKGIAEGIAASSELFKLREHAKNVYRHESSFDDVDDPSTGLDADIYKHHYGVPITTRDPDAQPFNPTGQQILDYLLDPTVKTDAAVKMKELYGDQYKKLSRARSTGLDIDKQKAKTGGPLIASTNKWVDFALRQELRNAVQSGNEWLTISSPEMVQKMTMGQTHGQGEFYGKIVPQRLQKIIRSFDKNAKLQKTSILTADGEKEVLGIRLTDDLVRKIADKGMPIFSNASAPAASIGLLSATDTQQQQQPMRGLLQ